MKCDLCKLRAVVNFQKVWTKFRIDKNDNYREDKNFSGFDVEEPIERDNVHLCRRHSGQWLNGEV